MRLIIDIPDRIHYGIEKGITVNGSSASQIVLDAVKNGTLLPKGCDVQRIVPKRVDVQKWIYTECPNPNCNYELSTHHGDGYYSIEDTPSFCPECGQALLWKGEDKDG